LRPFCSTHTAQTHSTNAQALIDPKRGHKFTFGECGCEREAGNVHDAFSSRRMPCGEGELCLTPHNKTPPKHTPTATTLSALHFLASAASIWITQIVTGAPRPKLPWGGAFFFC
jgi:hypothetical protein